MSLVLLIRAVFTKNMRSPDKFYHGLTYVKFLLPWFGIKLHSTAKRIIFFNIKLSARILYVTLSIAYKTG